MKRFLALVFLGVTAAAQAAMIEVPSRIRPGLRLGTSVSTESTSQSSNYYNTYGASGIVGFVTGAFVELPLAARVSLIPELDFIMKGAKFNPYGANAYTDRLNYLELPVLVKLHWDWTSITVFTKFGPEVGILLSANSTDAISGTSSSASGRYRSWDFGGAVGGGCVLPMGEHLAVEFEARMGVSILDVDTTATTSRNFDVQLTAGLLF